MRIGLHGLPGRPERQVFHRVPVIGKRDQLVLIVREISAERQRHIFAGDQVAGKHHLDTLVAHRTHVGQD